MLPNGPSQRSPALLSEQEECRDDKTPACGPGHPERVNSTCVPHRSPSFGLLRTHRPCWPLALKPVSLLALALGLAWLALMRSELAAGSRRELGLNGPSAAALPEREWWHADQGVEAAAADPASGLDPRLLARIQRDLAPFNRSGISLRMVEQAYCRSIQQGFRLQVRAADLLAADLLDLDLAGDLARASSQAPV